VLAKKVVTAPWVPAATNDKKALSGWKGESWRRSETWRAYGSSSAVFIALFVQSVRVRYDGGRGRIVEFVRFDMLLNDGGRKRSNDL
jgi:hypothetical protein